MDGTANLYVINPNGIVFGPDAQLDIRGSFLASTADQISLENGYRFSAVDPEAPPLLAVNAPAGLTTWLPTGGAVVSEADLSTGGNLGLVGSELMVQGQLRAGGDLVLVATDRLLAQDTALQPLIFVADNTLLLQGNQALDVIVLTNPTSGLQAGGNLILRSDGIITGDAHFVAGGDFRIETLTGTAGAFASPNDPVVRASGDVSFDSYIGASLHILAGGSVTAGLIDIIGPDVTGNALQETVTLSDGVTTVAIDGVNEPTLDIRAGTLAVGGAGIVGDTAGFTPGPPATAGTGARADITVDSIFNPGGLVFLSNQVAPNMALPGDITVGEIITADFNGGGDVVIDSKGAVSTTFIDVSGGDVFGYLATFDPSLFNGNSGSLTFLADGQITLPEGSEVFTYGLEGGGVTFQSDAAIVQEPFSVIEGSTIDVGAGGLFSFVAPLVAFNGSVITFLEGEGTGSAINVVAETFATQDIDFVTIVIGLGQAGDVAIQANQINLDNTFLGSINESFLEGQAGDVVIVTDALTATNGTQIGSNTAAFAFGDAGDVTVTASEAIALDGFLPGGILGDDAIPTGILSSVDLEAEGDGGTVNITTPVLSLTNGAQVRSSSLGFGDAGQINIEASEAILLDGAIYDAFSDTTFPSSIVSEVVLAGTGQGGAITLTTGQLIATNGGVISASTDSAERAGNLTIVASESVTFDGVTAFDSPTLLEEFAVRDSGVRSDALDLATGRGGDIYFSTPDRSVSGGATLEASTLGVGTAGNFKLPVSDTVLVDGAGSAILANTLPGSTGAGGNIIIDPQLVIVRNGGRIAVDSQGEGTGGTIDIVSGQLRLNQGLITAETVASEGGNIILNIGEIITLQNGSRITTTAGTELQGGNGGEITINTIYVVATPDENNDITANAFEGAGGDVRVTAEGIFGLTPRSRAELEQLLGTSDPVLLDPINLPSSDITAISRTNPQLDGQVVISSPDIDPNQGMIALPENIVDASRLIAQGCSGGSIAATEIGSLIVTGRGGLPSDPTSTLTGNQLLLDWATAEDTSSSNGNVTSRETPQTTPATMTAETRPQQLQEVQALSINEAGQVVLLAQGEGQLSAAGSGLPVLTCAGAIQEE